MKLNNSLKLLTLLIPLAACANHHDENLNTEPTVNQDQTTLNKVEKETTTVFDEAGNAVGKTTGKIFHGVGKIGKSTVKGAETVGKTTGKVVKGVGDTTIHGVETVGKTTGKVVKGAGNATKKGVETSVDATKNTGKKIGGAVDNTVKKGKHGVEEVTKDVKNDL